MITNRNFFIVCRKYHVLTTLIIGKLQTRLFLVISTECNWQTFIQLVPKSSLDLFGAHGESERTDLLFEGFIFEESDNGRHEMHVNDSWSWCVFSNQHKRSCGTTVEALYIR